MKNLNLGEVKEMELFSGVPAGGYVAEIKNVYDNTQKGQLELNLDIAEGEFANHFETLYNNKGFWALKGFRTYENPTDAKKDEYCKRFFKGFITTIEKSNQGYDFINTNYDEKTLIGKKVGIVLGEKEYVGNDGRVKTKLYVSEFKTLDDLKKGDYKVPELIKLKQDEVSTTSTTDDDLPF